MALPHFTNIDSHKNKWEPIHKSLYEVDIILPDAIASLHPNATHLLLENTTEINMPKYPTLGKGQQRFKYSTRLFTMLPESTSFEDLTIKFNLNQNDNKQIFNYRMMKDWYDLAWNNEDGSVSYKKDMTGDVIIYMHDKAGEVIRRVTCYNVMINDFSGIEDLAWESTGEIFDLTCKFYADYWSEFIY
jgi:hypothetical protein